MDHQEIIIVGEINITPLVKAQKTLAKGLVEAHETKSRLTRDGVIQRFEYSFELAWKTLKRILKYKGIEANSPRDVFREAARVNLIDDPMMWFQFLDNRNNLTCVYNENIADNIYGTIPMFDTELQKLIEQITLL